MYCTSASALATSGSSWESHSANGAARLHVVPALAVGLVDGNLPPAVEAGLVQQLHARPLPLIRLCTRLNRQWAAANVGFHGRGSDPAVPSAKIDMTKPRPYQMLQDFATPWTAKDETAVHSGYSL